MRIVLCDDDEHILVKLQKYLREYFQVNHLSQLAYAVYTSGEALLEKETAGANENIDIAFLDVEMPGLSGIHTGAQLKEFHPHAKVFIVTSYPDYLDEAMKFHVFRYLSKPIDKKRLFRNMKDALYQLSVDTRKVTIETKDKTIVRSADEIIMVETLERKASVCTVDGTYETVTPAKQWDSLLDIGCFFRPHRGYIINFKYIDSFTHDKVFLTSPLGKEYSAYLTRRKYQQFKEAHLLYLEAMS